MKKESKDNMYEGGMKEELRETMKQGAWKKNTSNMQAKIFFFREWYLLRIEAGNPPRNIA